MWRPLLKSSSSEAMSERLSVAFNRYFQPREARNLAVGAESLEAELVGLFAPMAGVHVSSTRGFVHAALGLAGARDVQIEMGRPVFDGMLEGVALVRARFVVRWSR